MELYMKIIFPLQVLSVHFLNVFAPTILVLCCSFSIEVSLPKKLFQNALSWQVSS